MRAIFPQRHLEKSKWFSKFEVIKGWTEAMQLMVGSQILEWWPHGYNRDADRDYLRTIMCTDAQFVSHSR